MLLLKDVVGWPTEEIAAALELTVSSMNSALHRARETVAARPRGPIEEPAPEVLSAYVQSWMMRDIDALVALLRKDVIFAMPPHAGWFHGADAVRAFLQSSRFHAFWTSGLRVMPTRANGLPAVAWYSTRDSDDGAHRLHSIHVMRFEDGSLAEAISFIGPHYLHGFDLPPVLSE